MAGRTRRKIDTSQRGTYKVLRDHFRQQCNARREPCHLCGNSIDYGLQHGSPWAWELDHLVPVIVDESLSMEPRNFAAAHSVCNKRRKDGELPGAANGALGEPSELW